MTHTGSIRFFPKTRLKSRLGGGEVAYSRLWAFHAQFAEVQPKNELYGTLPAENARDGPKGRYGEVPTVNAAKVGQRICRDLGAERAAGALKRNHSSVFTPPLSRLRRQSFAPVAQILRSGELRCEWTMLVPNEAVIRHG
jgi:hypothetical protein